MSTSITEQTEKLSGGVVPPTVKAFISIPISGQEKEAQQRAKEIKDWLIENFNDMEVTTPFEISNNDLDKPYHWYMGKDIEKLLQCDIVIQAEGWGKSKGCQCEAATADVYGIRRIQYQDIHELVVESYEPKSNTIRFFSLTLDGITRVDVPKTAATRQLINRDLFLTFEEASEAFHRRKTASTKISESLSQQADLIAMSAVLFYDANNIFGAEQSGLDYYRKNLPTVEVKDEKEEVVDKYQFIPMRVK